MRQNGALWFEDVHLNTIAQGSKSFTQEQIVLIFSIATQCPLTGGTAVFKARSLYALVSDTIFEDDLMCQQLAQKNKLFPSSKPITENKFVISPNPAKNQIRVDWNIPTDKEVVLTIFTPLGQTVRQLSFNLKERFLIVNTETLKPDIYHICLKTDSGKDYCDKLVIIR